MAVLVLVLVPGAAQAQDTTVATLERPSEVRELDGIVVYSAFDPAIDAYRLTVRDAEGVRALPVAPSAEPFEADIGTNSSGDPQVVFSVDVGPVPVLVAQLDGDVHDVAGLGAIHRHL
ncbi:MAG: hypothetical protein M3481_13020 [Actinomycetota bacterium]|nr:hypothetical protein [Actinomycetota bacterium]